ncbi:DNA mismatch endonuclease Vsr [Bradyrhizobium yuanmingense]|uniref:very short patch repair endonuclease n=1 Tax=Bradyrhizobium yuanmingense TaxID=108015 RepID=UPI0035191033
MSCARAGLCLSPEHSVLHLPTATLSLMKAPGAVVNRSRDSVLALPRCARVPAWRCETRVPATHSFLRGAKFGTVGSRLMYEKALSSKRKTGVGQMDRLSKTQRSEHMARIRSKDTSPELAVRRTLFRLGYRFRLHGSDLPGTPDIVFRSQRKAVFIHGCFWHAHEGCSLAKLPKTRTEYWQAKFLRNAKRDRLSKQKLRKMGWKTLTVWECQVVREEHVVRRLTRYLGPATRGIQLEGTSNTLKR